MLNILMEICEMMSPVSPQFVYLIHKENERELVRQIELERDARQRGALEEVGALDPIRAWYAQAAQWMKAKLFNRAPESQETIFQEPCPGVPC
jgi:hypothetical protein